ncbi:MAG TPA: hypothetical protein VIF57_16555 [Polyangia bacterium]|jgi:hypothetical protein
MRYALKTLTLLSATLALSLSAARPARALEPDGSIAIRLPAGVALRNVALGATGPMNLADRSVVSGPAAGIGVVANVGPGQTQLGVSTNVITNVVSAAQAFLANNARIGGSLQTTAAPTLQQGAVIAGGTNPAAQLTPTSVIGWRPPAAGAGNDFTLPPDGNGAMAAGAFANVTIFSRARVTIGPGVYTMQSFDLEPQATATFDNRNGPIVFYVASSLITRGTITVLGSAGAFAIVYEGGNGTAIETPFAGTIVAPYAQLRLAAMGTKQFTGQFFGGSLVVDPDVHVNYGAFDWNIIRPLLGAGNGVAPTRPSPPVPNTPPPPAPCFAPSFNGSTTTVTSTGETVFTSLHFATPNAAQGICAPTFCDANDNPVPGPTDAQLNAPPPAGSTCPAMAAPDHCPVDTTTLSNTCTSDASCAAGSICASHCLDQNCTTIERRCGKPVATCGGLPQEGSCDEFLLCPRPGAVGTANAGAVAQQLPPTTTPKTIPDADKDVPPPTYATVAATRCAGAPQSTGNLGDGSNKPAHDGSGEWGIFVTPILEFNAAPVKRVDAISQFDVSGHGSLKAGGVLMGYTVTVLDADAHADVTDCGVTLGASLKFLGEDVAVWTQASGAAAGLTTTPGDTLGQTLATPTGLAGACSAALTLASDTHDKLRKANLFARSVRPYYDQFAFNTGFCNDVAGELHLSDPVTGQYDCAHPQNISEAGKHRLLDAWNTEYGVETTAYLNALGALNNAQAATATAGTVELFDDPHPYDVSIIDVPIPIGPIELDLAIDGFGSWDLKGGLQFGVGPASNLPGANALVSGALNGQTPVAGDLAAYAGPIITPELTIGVTAFVGVGIPGVSVGIQGQIDLLDITLPTGATIGLARLTSPDTRPVAGTDFAGTMIPGLETKDYRWATGYNWGSSLDMEELNGEMDLAVRIHFLFFKHTFRQKLFGWHGFHQTFPLVSGGGTIAGIPSITSAGDFGTTTDNIAFTTPVALIADNPVHVGTTEAPFACFVGPK